MAVTARIDIIDLLTDLVQYIHDHPQLADESLTRAMSKYGRMREAVDLLLIPCAESVLEAMTEYRESMGLEDRPASSIAPSSAS